MLNNIIIVLFNFFLWLVKVLPYNILQLFINMFSVFATIILKRYRKIASINYSLVYKREPGLVESFRITKNIFSILGMQSIDILTHIEKKYPHETFINKIYNISYLTEAMNRGKGAIILSAHVGNFAMLNMILAELGYPDCSMIMRGVKNKSIEAKLNIIRDRAHIKFFNESNTKKNTIVLAKYLKRKGILIMVTDQRHLKGRPLDFFGKTKKTPLGPAILSILTGAPIVPLFALRSKNGKSDIIVREPIYTDGMKMNDDSIRNISELTNNVLEEFIGENFQQWFCFHRWWK